jgi:hypothetical protein
MRTVHVLRKPTAGATVADSVTVYGAGALNVDACRISTRDNLNGGAYAAQGEDRWDGAENWRYKRGVLKEYTPPSGRWPANLILQHLAGCRQDGEKQVRSNGHFPASRGAGSSVSGQSGHRGQDELQERHMDGETVTAWVCTPECPVAALDQQSGVLCSHPGVYRKDKKFQGATWEMGAQKGHLTSTGDAGGASRFFKQIQGGRG